MSTFTTQALKITGIVLLLIVAFLLMGYLTMTLWNWLMPAIFGLPVINYYQAIGLVVLSKLLLGGIRVQPGPIGQRRWWKAKWESMSEKEREEFKREFAERCKARWGKDLPAPGGNNS
ncbi:MAG: hypothetical protein NZM35_01695 [Chitinophagales bacterium]|nr:hypothetical protein [Chitinophagales bacterium]MDW8418217.1 hypothetical protein [Chitinophagales bacterium]